MYTYLDTVDEEAAKAAIGVEIGCLYESERHHHHLHFRNNMKSFTNISHVFRHGKNRLFGTARAVLVLRHCTELVPNIKKVTVVPNNLPTCL